MELVVPSVIIVMVMYCQSCGHPNKGAKRANFCQNCGKGLGITGKVRKEPRPVRSARRSKLQEAVDHDESLDESDVLEVPSLTQLDVEIDVQKQRGIKFEDAIGTMNPELKEEDEGLQREPISDQEFLKQFQKEAGAIREE